MQIIGKPFYGGNYKESILENGEDHPVTENKL